MQNQCRAIARKCGMNASIECASDPSSLKESLLLDARLFLAMTHGEISEITSQVIPGVEASLLPPRLTRDSEEESHEVKVIVLGGPCGKTTLVRRLVEEDSRSSKKTSGFSLDIAQPKSTIGVSCETLSNLVTGHTLHVMDFFWSFRIYEA